MTSVFINDAAAFLPGAPVHNDDIESVLGALPGIGARTRRIVLKNHGIHTRYYAVDPKTGWLTHTNAQLAAEAVRRLSPRLGFSVQDIDCLCCGTSTPDLLLPGHALMVLGELRIPECDAVTTSGICVSGMTALKYAFMSVAAGSAENAVATGSELASSFTRARFMVPAMEGAHLKDLAEKPIRAFDADFLRWMLSDGAGAAYLSRQASPDTPCYRLEWIENRCYAGELSTCMYAGGFKAADGRTIGWRDVERVPQQSRGHLLSIRQDIKLLEKEIVATMGAALSRIIEKRNLRPEGIDYFLPHYSSAYFRPRFYEEMKRIGFEIPEESWFTNLPEKGNTGSAAIFIILAELFHSRRLSPGQRLLCFIPESGRFSHCFMHLTVSG